MSPFDVACVFLLLLFVFFIIFAILYAKYGGKSEVRREKVNSKRILSRILIDRAWEVLKAAESRYPEATRQIEEGLAHLVSKGKLKGPVARAHSQNDGLLIEQRILSVNIDFVFITYIH